MLNHRLTYMLTQNNPPVTLRVPPSFTQGGLFGTDKSVPYRYPLFTKSEIWMASPRGEAVEQGETDEVA